MNRLFRGQIALYFWLFATFVLLGGSCAEAADWVIVDMMDDLPTLTNVGYVDVRRTLYQHRATIQETGHGSF